MDSSDDDLAVRSTQTESGSIFDYDVTLEKSQCSYLELDVYGTDPRATGTVAGNVLTATEQAVESSVHLVNERDRSFSPESFQSLCRGLALSKCGLVCL
ncbi:MAG TPA: hypothetical protein VJ372_06780 [Pyrinomonadaceae bacterium]|nr:hypothetical protein [Pyrinomonadaceae bacterium]